MLWIFAFPLRLARPVRRLGFQLLILALLACMDLPGLQGRTRPPHIRGAGGAGAEG
jgi:hypothetical protein